MKMDLGYYCFPPEIWYIIVQLLSREDQRRMLFVSKPLHDCALSLLFSRVTIRFGLWVPDCNRPGPLYDNMDEEGELERQHNVSWEVLRRISRDPSFAQLVKVVSVRAFMGEGDTVFQLRALTDALESLPHLRAFYWDGMGPCINTHVVQVLATASSATLAELSVPIARGISTFLPLFENLQSLSLGARPLQHSMDDMYFEDRDVVEMQHCFETIPSALRRLWVYGNAIWDAPVGIFDRLQELCLFFPATLNGLGLVLHHCLDLRSFGLLLADIGTASSLRAAILEAPDSLPNVTSFKLIGDFLSQNYNVALPLVDFLRRKTQLRRLDLGFQSDGSNDRPFPILNPISSLPRVESLERLDSELPLGLTALLLHLDFAYSDDGIQQGLIDMIKKRNKLRYLHILDTGVIFDLKQQLLEDHPPSLELAGYGPYLRWLEKDPESGNPAYSTPWGWDQVVFRGVGDFGCEDWEWLLRGHGWWTLDNLAPGTMS
ncbi:hypothetical protein GY45DRAFT_1365372 [Cubamyces sp. BRFM 1775]|nr:hypothetical protein GY45DRAFT_1365372 [Cubamyces sp. BRFM 1775]